MSLSRFWTILTLGCASLLAYSRPADAEPHGHFTWGQVLDADSGRPLAGATLVDPASGERTETDETGTFFVARPLTVLQVTCDGYQSQAFQFAKPSLVAQRGVRDTGSRTRLTDSGFALRLRPAGPEPAARVLPSQLTLGWRPDALVERHSGLDGVRFDGYGPRPSAAWLDGALRLGPALLSGTYGSQWYQMQRSDTAQPFGRWQHQGTVALSYAHQWGSRLAAAVGPAVVLQQISLVDAPAPQGRSQDYLDVASTRWGAGLQAMVSAWPLPAVPVTLEARLGLFPATWQLTDSVNLAPGGMWAMQGSAGVRWYPTPKLGMDLRYLYDHWQTTAYYQGSHGAALGGVIVF